MCNRKLRIRKRKINAGSEHEKHRTLFMMRSIAVYGVMCILCGCTRREQLVLETDSTKLQQTEAAEEMSDEGQAGQGQVRSEEIRQEDQEQSVSGTAEPQTREQSSSETETMNRLQQNGESETICVHVCGAVRKAGVYELPAGSRVYEAVEKAGGFAEEADESYVNQAQQLSDGSKLVIPTVDQAQNASESGSAGAEQIGIVEQEEAPAGRDSMSAGTDSGTNEDGKININTASEAQLCEIPGIGAARAAAISAYRQEHGGFKSIEEIMNVSGIKEGTYAKIKDSIKVN